MSEKDQTVALLVPCYDAADFLPDLVASARRQTRPFDQIICFDDGSSDGTAQIAKQLGIEVISSRQNHGPSFARNRLMEAATTDFIHFHDADDAFLDDRFLELMLPAADEQTAAFCSWLRVSKIGEETCFDYTDVSDRTDWVDFFINRHVHLNALVLPRRFFTDSARCFNQAFRIQEDLLFNLSAAAAGLKFSHVEPMLAAHIRRSGSTLDSWDPIAFHSKSLELCAAAEIILAEPHRQTLGEKALYHSRQLLSVGADWQTARTGVEIARRCGLDRSVSGGVAERFLSRMFGHGAGLRYFRARSRFNKQVAS